MASVGPTPAIVLNQVHKVYYTGSMPVHAVHGVSMVVDEGEFLAIMGPSGCGKSTLLNLMGAVDKPTQGVVRILGNNPATMTDNQLSDLRRDRLGFVFQFYNLIPSLTAFENIELPLLFAGKKKKERETRVRLLLKEVGLEDRADHTPSLLSGGEQQRVAIARALANDPSIMLLDEPTGNLDRHTGEEILSLLTRLRREKMRTYVMVTHDPAIAQNGDRSISMIDGRIAGEKRNVASDPAPARTAARAARAAAAAASSSTASPTTP